MSTTKQRLAKGIRWAARIVGLPVTLFLSMMAIGEGVQSGLSEGFGTIFTLQGSILGLSMVTGLAGCIISWWRVRLAGILLIAAAIGLDVAMVPEHQEGMSRFLAGAGFGFLPFFMVGVLFLLSWWLSKKPSPSALPPSPTS